MRHLSLALFLTLPLFQLPLFSQVITDNKVVIQTTYEIGDQSVYELKTLIEDTNDGNTTTETNTYDLKITVTDTITGNYKIRMDCSNWKTQSATKATDLSLRELGSSIPYSYQINPSGTFVNTDGSTNLRTTIHTLLDKYIAEKGKSSNNSHRKRCILTSGKVDQTHKKGHKNQTNTDS
ncbi:MAG: hypothetical protein AB8G22_12765 [Saprospiraceae bacterium]